MFASFAQRPKLKKLFTAPHIPGHPRPTTFGASSSGTRRQSKTRSREPDTSPSICSLSSCPSLASVYASLITKQQLSSALHSRTTSYRKLPGRSSGPGRGEGEGRPQLQKCLPFNQQRRPCGRFQAHSLTPRLQPETMQSAVASSMTLRDQSRAPAQGAALAPWSVPLQEAWVYSLSVRVRRPRLKRHNPQSSRLRELSIRSCSSTRAIRIWIPIAVVSCLAT